LPLHVVVATGKAHNVGDFHRMSYLRMD
jgi:hypothetical protein